MAAAARPNGSEPPRITAACRAASASSPATSAATARAYAAVGEPAASSSEIAART